MPFAVTHILAAVILIELFRNYFVKNNKRFPRYYIIIAAIGAIIPDLDIGVYYILSFFGFTFDQIHRTFLHTLFIPLILFLIGLISLRIEIWRAKLGRYHMKLSTALFIFAFGSLLHLILDAIIIGQIILFYPFSNFSIGLNLINYLPSGIQGTALLSLDAALLLFWIFWMEFKLKISNYF
ncbi:MAG: metal-dependent hydrolase [Candidatus Pacearchaeota archaeon]